MARDRSTPRRGGGPWPDAGRRPAAADRGQSSRRPPLSARWRPPTLISPLAAYSRKRCGPRVAILDRRAFGPRPIGRSRALGLRQPAVAASDRFDLSVPTL